MGLPFTIAAGFASAIILRFQSRVTHDHILVSQENTVILVWSSCPMARQASRRKYHSQQSFPVLRDTCLSSCYQAMTLFFSHITILHWPTASAVNAKSFITLWLTPQLTGGFATSVLYMDIFDFIFNQIKNLFRILFTIFPCWVWSYWYILVIVNTAELLRNVDLRFPLSLRNWTDWTDHMSVEKLILSVKWSNTLSLITRLLQVEASPHTYQILCQQTSCICLVFRCVNLNSEVDCSCRIS
jgi:hypothetical protein